MERRLFAVLVHNHWKGIGRYSAVGLELALSTILGLLAGRWLDNKFATEPWLALLGFLIGVTAGYRTLHQALQRANREAEQSEREDREARKKFHDDSR